MAKTLLLGVIMAMVATGAFAQDAAREAPAKAPPGGGAGVRSGYITSTGETVAKPGLSQSDGVTPLDRGIQREDSRIQGSICKGC
jgi:hypothetical protein